MTELSEQDKQRIRLEARNRFLQSDRDQNFIDGAEYATRYEREQQEKPVLLTEALKQASTLLLDGDEGYKLQRVAELIQLKAERTELIGKLQARLERCRKVSGYSSGFSDIHNEIDFLDLLLNSLKK